MKRILAAVCIIGMQIFVCSAMAAGSVAIENIKDGAQFTADTVDMGFGPSIMLPPGKQWLVVKRTEFDGTLKNWPMVRFTLLNTSATDALQMVTVATNLTRVRVPSPTSDKCIKLPGTLTQNYLNLGSNLYGCSAFLTLRNFKEALPDLIATTMEERSFGLLSAFLKPLAANPALLDRIGRNPVIASDVMYRFGKQHTFYSVVLQNNSDYAPTADPTIDAKMDSWVRDFFSAVHSYLNEDPVLKVASLTPPDLKQYVAQSHIPKLPSTDTVKLRAPDGTSLWMDERFTALPKNNRILLATKDRKYVRWYDSGWLGSLMYAGSTTFSFPKEGVYEFVIVNDEVYENFPNQMAN